MSIREDLQRVYDKYVTSYRARDAAGCAGVFTVDGELFSPYAPPARGRATVEALHREWTRLGGEDKQLTVTNAGSSGDLAWCLAGYSDAQETGTSLNVFQRQPDGNWLIRICSLNENKS
jgi:ketosteroid isomerase-like protein